MKTSHFTLSEGTIVFAIRCIITAVIAIASWVLMFMGLNWLLASDINLPLALAIVHMIDGIIPGLILMLLWVGGIVSFDPHERPSRKE